MVIISQYIQIANNYTVHDICCMLIIPQYMLYVNYMLYVSYTQYMLYVSYTSIK